MKISLQKKQELVCTVQGKILEAINSQSLYHLAVLSHSAFRQCRA